ASRGGSAAARQGDRRLACCRRLGDAIDHEREHQCPVDHDRRTRCAVAVVRPTVGRRHGGRGPHGHWRRSDRDAAAMAARMFWAKDATLKPGSTLSTRIRSLMEFRTRSGRIAWYSGEWYQSSAWLIEGNSMRTTAPGHAPSTTFTSPCASHAPPYGLTVL